MIFIILKALFIGIILGALLFWFSSRKQGEATTVDAQLDAKEGCARSGWSVCGRFVRNLLLLILLVLLPLLIIRIIL